MTTVLNFTDELIRRWCYDEIEKAPIDRIKPPYMLTQQADGVQVDTSVFDLPKGKYQMIFDCSYIGIAVIRQVNEKVYYALPMAYPSDLDSLHLALRHGKFASNVNATTRYNCDLFTVTKDKNNNPIFSV